MRELIRKEWRENRALILGFLILAPTLSLALKGLVVGFAKTAPSDSIQFVIPAMLGLYVLAIASDLVAGDAASGRLGFLAALPVRPATIWAAKALFLFGTATLYLGWLLAAEAAILAALGKEAYWLFQLVAKEAAFLPLFFLGGAATLFFSTLIDRGFAAAFAALVAIAGFGFLVLAFDLERFDFRDSALRALMAKGSLVLTAGFLGGSLLAFTKGRIHLGGRLRRAVLATLALLALVVPPAAASATALEDWLSIDPWDDRLGFGTPYVSPDGRWAFGSATRRGDGPLGLRGGSYGPEALYAVCTEDGRIRDLTEVGRIRDRERSFAHPGRVLLHRIVRDGSKQIPIHVDYDLEAGEPRTTRAVDPAIYRTVIPRRSGPHRFEFGRRKNRVLPADGPPIDLPGRWYATPAGRDWGIGVATFHEKERPKRYGVLLVATGEIRELPAFPALLPGTRDGSAIGRTRDGIWRIPIEGGEPERILEGEKLSLVPSPDYRTAVAVVDGTAYLVRADGSPPRFLARHATRHPHWAPNATRFLLRVRGDWTVGDAATGELSPFPLPRIHQHVSWFDGRAAIVPDRQRGSVHVFRADGTSRRLLPPEDDR